MALTKMAPMKRRAEIWSILGDHVAVVVDSAAAKLKAPFSGSTDNSDGRDYEEIPKRVACGFRVSIIFFRFLASRRTNNVKPTRECETSRDENIDNRDW